MKRLTYQRKNARIRRLFQRWNKTFASRHWQLFKRECFRLDYMSARAKLRTLTNA